MIPPLRQRKEDIPSLTEHFLVLFAKEMGMDPPELNAEALNVLEEYHFPGNIRELKNIIERAIIESGGQEIHPEHLYFFDSLPQPLGGEDSADEKAPPTGPSLGEMPFDLAEAEKILIQRALDHTDGNIAAAARLLKTSRPHIYRVIKRDKDGQP